MRVERLTGPEAFGDIVAEWNLLDRQISPRMPYSSPAWIISWWKHFPHRRPPLFHDEFFCHVVRDDGGSLVAVAPLMRTSFPGIGPPLLRMVQFFGVDPMLTEIRGVICRPEEQALVVAALVEHFLARRNEWDVFRWAGLRQVAECYSAETPLCAFRPRGELPDFVVDLPKSWEELRMRVTCKVRKGLRKPYELFKRDGIPIALRVTERPDEAAAAMARFLALQVARSEAAGMAPHPNKFVQPHERSFLADYLHGAAERGELRIFELEIRGVAVASRIGFLIGSDLYLYYAGYDPAWKDYSAMTALMEEIFKWAIARGVQRVNLSTGDERSKTRWKPREVLFHNAVQVSPTWRARAALRVFQAYEAAFRARDEAVHPPYTHSTTADQPQPPPLAKAYAGCSESAPGGELPQLARCGRPAITTTNS